MFLSTFLYGPSISTEKYLGIPPSHLEPFYVRNNYFLPFPKCPSACLNPALSPAQLTSNFIGSVPSAFKCAPTFTMLRNNYNYNPSSITWCLPLAAYKSLFFPLPQNFLNTYLHSFVLSLPNHALILSNLNSAPAALPKLHLLHFLLNVSGTERSKTEFIIFSVKLVSHPIILGVSKWFKPETLAPSFTPLVSVLLPHLTSIYSPSLDISDSIPTVPSHYQLWLRLLQHILARFLFCLLFLKSPLHITVGINFLLKIDMLTLLLKTI